MRVYVYAYTSANPLMACTDRFFKGRILSALEERNLIRKVLTRVPLETPADKAEALAKAVKITRRRQRNLALTPEVGLGKGFRLQKAERKIWEAKVYSLPVERVEPEMTKTEYAWEVCGMTVEAEREALQKAGFAGVNVAPRKTEVETVDMVDRDEMGASTGQVIPLTPDILSTDHLENVLQTESLPTQLRPDPTKEAPLPRALPAESPLIQATSLVLSHPSIASRWRSAAQAERSFNEVLEHERREIDIRRQQRRDMYKQMKEDRKVKQAEKYRDELEGRPDLLQKVEKFYGNRDGAEKVWKGESFTRGAGW